MKKFGKLLLGSVLTVVLCASLIGGATLALFTSQSDTNIAVTSGKVDISASVNGLKLYSYTEQSDGSYQSTLLDSTTKFAFGGTAALDGNSLALGGMIPGDKAEFTIAIDNNSNVDVKYQFVLTLDGDKELLSALDISVDGADFVPDGFGGGRRTNWTTWTAADTVRSKQATVVVELPYGYDDVFGSEGSAQDKTCGIHFTVSAIQANAPTEDPSPSADILYIYSMDQFAEFADMVAGGEDYSGKTIVLKTDLNFEGAHKISLFVVDDVRLVSVGSPEFPFRGNFDGEDHVVSGYTVQATDDATVAGLFGCIENATVANLHFVGAHISASGATRAAVAVGQARGKVDMHNVTVELATAAEVSDDAKVGGLVGDAAGSTLTVDDCTFSGDGVDELVAEQRGANVEVTDSSIVDSAGESVAEWNAQGNKITVVKVGSAEELSEVFDTYADTSSIKIVLTADIDTKTLVPHEQYRDTWTGSDREHGANFSYYFESFAGELDGNDFSITFNTNQSVSGYENRTDRSGSLFQTLQGGAYIHNLSFEINSPAKNLGNTAYNYYAKNRLAYGALAYEISSSSKDEVITIENVVVNGFAQAVRTAFIDNGVKNTTGTINFIDCVNNMNYEMSGTDDSGKVAAFFCEPGSWNVHFTRCTNNGKIDNTSQATLYSPSCMGGFIAIVRGDGNNEITFTDCKNVGSLKMTIAPNGQNEDRTLSGIGGFIGRIVKAKSVTFTNCANTGDVERIGYLKWGNATQNNIISAGGFIGRAEECAVVFNGTNVNGEYTEADGIKTAVEGKGSISVRDSYLGVVYVGGYIGYATDKSNVTFGGTVVNAVNISSAQKSNRSTALDMYIGGFIGMSEGNVTFAEDCDYSNLGNFSGTITYQTDSEIYFGGIIGYVSKGTVTVAEGATGSNSGTTFTASGADVTATGSFAGRVAPGIALSDSLGAFDGGSVDSKIGANE